MMVTFVYENLQGTLARDISIMDTKVVCFSVVTL